MRSALSLLTHSRTEWGSTANDPPDTQPLFFLTNKTPILSEQQHTCLKILNFTEVSSGEVPLCNRFWPNLEVLVGIPSQMKSSLGESPQTYILPKNWAWRIQLLPLQHQNNPTLMLQNSERAWRPGLLVTEDRFNPISSNTLIQFPTICN